jgi:hypothetical protein
MENESLAYLAGFFDGEGCVGIKRSGNSFQLYATIGQNKPFVLTKIVEMFGGSIRKNKNISVYWCSAKVARKFLKAIAPFSVIKKAEIEMALAAFEPQSFQKKMGVPAGISKLRVDSKKGIEALRRIEIISYANKVLH